MAYTSVYVIFFFVTLRLELCANKNTNMRIKFISIQNFRAIHNFECTCDEAVNVIYGINGAGKSTIVQALKILLSWPIRRILNPNGNGTALTDKDISKGASFCSLEVTLDDLQETTWKLYRQRSTERTKAEVSNLKQLMVYANEWVYEHSKNGAITSMPAIGIFDVNRAVIEVPQRLVRQGTMSPADAYDGKTDFKSFFHWYREREDIENEKIRELFFSHKESNEIKLDVQLSAVRRAIEQVLPQYGDFHVVRNPRRFVMKKNGESFDFSNFSDGEKCYITLVGAIARKLAMTHPDSENPLDERGIFIIDEIDLHLHPEWQQTVVTKLRDTFKHCQFFMTTHSPIVLSGVRTYDGEQIFAVQNGNVILQTGKIFGGQVQDILLRQFNISSLRSPEADKLLNQWREKINNGKVNDEEYKALRAKILHWINPVDSEIMQLLLEEKKMQKTNEKD